MTDWAWNAIDHPLEIGKMKQEGVAPEAGILPRLASYESLRWYGNGTVQAALWILFLISFSANTIAGAWCCLARIFRRRQCVALPASNRVVNLKRAIGALNLLILVALTITVLLSSVTAPVCARTRPSTVAPVVSEIEVAARMVPTK